MKRGVSFYILIILALGALVGLIFILAPGRTPDTPPVVLSPSPAPDSASAVATPAPSAEAVIAVTPETVQAAIATLSRADSYSRTLTVQNFWNGGSATTELDVWARGENLRLSIRDGARPEGLRKNILIKGEDAWVWYSDSGSVWHGSAGTGDADAYQMLLTYEDVLSLDKENILEAGYADYNGENCIFVRYRAGALDYTHLCYISDATGLLMATETYDGDVLVSAMRSSRPDISTPGDEIFVEPQ